MRSSDQPAASGRQRRIRISLNRWIARAVQLSDGRRFDALGDFAGASGYSNSQSISDHLRRGLKFDQIAEKRAAFLSAPSPTEFPPPGWTAVLGKEGIYFKGSRVLTEERLRALMGRVAKGKKLTTQGGHCPVTTA